jgi:hypothetical protein
VIEQHVREKLGVEPGMLAIQRVVDDHVELRFVQGEHNRSLAGSLRAHITPRPDLWDSDAFEAAAEAAWADAAVERYVRTLPKKAVRRRADSGKR